jgi:glucose/arabinose dehydrogenase
MLGRRFLVLVAVLMGLTALAATLAPRDPALQSPERRPTPTPQAAAPAAPEEAEPSTKVRTVSADAEEPQRVFVREGDLVRLEVKGAEPDSVRVMNRIDALPARFHFLAGAPDEHDITLLSDDRVVGVLEIRD